MSNFFEQQQEEFFGRHIGTLTTKEEMLDDIGAGTMDELIDKTIPRSIRRNDNMALPESMSEAAMLQHLKELSLKNQVYTSHIGQGYYDTITPSVILRNVFENPGWYTQYTPYQAEISQGRLESLLNFQTMVSDLTGLPIANASLLDEATAAAEAMNLLFHQYGKGDTSGGKWIFVDEQCFRQVIDVVITRATPLNIKVVTGDYRNFEVAEGCFGAILQYPAANGEIRDYREFIGKLHAAKIGVAMGTDLLALTILTSPGELGADIAYGNSQRFGVPLGYGGPHAAFFAVKDEYKRSMPGRIIGISIDAQGNRALRMALQTREQHIKREKATSNICTAQALLANMAAMYAVYHGPKGLKQIALRTHQLTNALANALTELGYTIAGQNYFDTIQVTGADIARVKQFAENASLNFYYGDKSEIGIALDETTTSRQVINIAHVFAQAKDADDVSIVIDQLDDAGATLPDFAKRTSPYLQHPVFNTHTTESQMMRYIKMLENKDLSLNTSMISLGSCTMKLNAATQMIPLSWTHWSKMHPFAPLHQAAGYQQMMTELADYLCTITGFDKCWLQPNSGAQGEYAGLLAIRNYHLKRGDANRNIMLIPISAHGTNPASAVMAGMKVVVVKALDNGYIDVEDFKAKAEQYSGQLAGTMITYPSTYGIFEESVKEICDLVHAYGGQVYMDGANMNAQVGLTSPAHIGADVCHLNLHKTFAIPHGGGGPGMGPICFGAHLHDSFMQMPGYTLADNSGDLRNVSAAPFGSASILLISYSYIRMLGAKGLQLSTEHAILNANYMRARLQDRYPILYTGHGGTCAHEFIVDLRPFKNTAGVEAEDVAKRLMDYGFHAPTMSFPVAGTIMIEPTESEDKAELDRFCDALLSIRDEIEAIEKGEADKASNVLKHAPHTQMVVMNDSWDKPYSRQQAAFPLPYVQYNKFWPSISRINNTYGDRNLICTCEPMESYMEEPATA